MADEQPDGGQSEYDVASLRVTREEAREALDHQIDALNDIDDKAAQTLRLNVLLLGAVLTTASILVSSNGTPPIRRMVNGLVVAGAIVSAFSMVTSIWAYASTSYRTGTGPSDVRALLSRSPTEKELLTALLYNYAMWMERNARQNRRDGFTLFVSNVCLFLAMGYYASGIAFGFYLSDVGEWVSILVVVVLGFFMTLSVVAIRHRLSVRFLEAVRSRLLGKP